MFGVYIGNLMHTPWQGMRMTLICVKVVITSPRDLYWCYSERYGDTHSI
jgi:hypothetical protein